MALDRLTKIDGGGISTTSDYRVGVITATKFVGPIEGSITATDATFSGNVSIAGTLTYEDVINVDSVGVGTFREGIFLPDNKKLQFGNAAGSADLEIFHSSSENKTIIDNNTNDLDIASDVIRLKNSARSETLATFIGNGGVSLYYDNSIKLGTAGWGIQATGILKIADATDSSGATNHLALGASNDLKLFHDGSHNRIHGSTGFLDINNSADLISITASNRIDISDDFIRLRSRNGSDVYMTGTVNSSVDLYFNGSKKFETTNSGISVTGNIIGTGNLNVAGNIEVDDNDSIFVGTGNDLRVFHNGTTTFIRSNGTGAPINIDNHTGAKNAVFNPAGSTELYFNNNKKLETTSDGITIHNSNLLIQDSKRLKVGTDADLALFFNGTTSFIRTQTSSTLRIDHSATGEVMGQFIPNGAVELYFNGGKKVETTSAGITVTGSATASTFAATNNVSAGGNIVINSDTGRLRLGASNDLELFHNGSNSYIQDNGTGALLIGSGNSSGAGVYIRGKHGEESIICNSNGSVDLYYDNSKKFATSNTGATVTGSLNLTGNITINNVAPKIFLTDSDSNSDFAIRNMHGVFGIHDSTNGADRFTVDSSGNVGIGTDNPGGILDVLTSMGRIKFNNSGSIGSRIDFANADGTVRSSIHNYGGSNEILALNTSSTINFNVANSTKMKLVSNGNVGIKSTSPRGKLDIGFDGAPNFITFGSDADNPKVEFFRHTGGAPSHYATEIQQILGDLALSTAAIANLGGHSYTERLRITSAGRVGIGSDTPVAHLDVANYQNIEVLRLRDRHYNKYLTIRGGGSPNRMVIDSYEGGGGGAAIDLASNGDTKVRITSDGKLLVGATAATSNGIAEFHRQVNGGAQGCHILVKNTSTDSVNNTARLKLETSGGTAEFFAFAAAETYLRSRTGGAANLLLLADGASKIRMFTNGNEVVNVDSDGRLLVNTTTGFAGDNTMIIAGESPSGGTYDLYDGQLLITSTETSGAVNTGGVIQFYGHDGGSSRGFGSIRCLKENGTSGNHNAYMAFLLRVNGGNPTERLRINSTGDIGINYSGTPNATLDIRTDRDPSNGVMCFLRNNTNDGNGAMYGMDINGCGTWSCGMLDNSNAFSIVKNLGNSGTEYFRVASNGNVHTNGLGTFEFNNGWSAEGRNVVVWPCDDAGNWFSFVGTNLRFTDGGNFVKPSDNSNSNWGNIAGLVFEGVNQNNSNGDHPAIRFVVDQPGGNGLNYSLGSGSSGRTAAIDNNTVMSISGNGNVGIGEDDPDENTLLIRAASTFQTNKGHIMLTGDSATVGQGPQIVFSESGATTSYAGGYVGFVRQGGNSVGDLVFGTRGTSGDANTVPTERLRITSGGLVNITGGNLHVGQDGATANFTDSNNGNTKHIEIGATGGGDALLTTHSSGYGIGYFGYEAGGDRLIIACDDGGGANTIDFVTNAGTSTGGGSDNLNGKQPKMRIKSGGGGVQIYVHESATDFQPKHDVTALLIQNGIGGGDIGNTSEPTHIDWAWVDSNDNDRPQCRISGNVGNGGDPNSLQLEGKGFLTFHCSDSNSTSTNDIDPPQRLRIAHDGTFTGSQNNNISDQRLKENIATITDPITKIKALKGRTFTWKSEARMREGTHYGFIAQEVESIIPDLIVDNTGIRVFDKDDNLLPSNVITPPVGGGYAKSVTADGVTPVLVEALKEALAKIEILEAKVAALEGS